MRRPALASLALLTLGGCGYVGPVLPPSPQIPREVTNLVAVERGDQLDISFDTPVRTVDALPIDEFSRIEVRVGPASEPFDFPSWEAASKPYIINNRYVVGDDGEPRPVAIRKQLPLSEWQGKTIAVSVRTAVKKRGNDSAWAKPVILKVVEPVASPSIQVAATADGYRVTWEPDGTGLRHRILRKDPGAQQAEEVSTTDRDSFVDGTSRWDTKYEYSVVALADKAESLPSKPVSVDHADTFPPAVPVGLVALAGPDSVELTWPRNTEPDLKAYILYRSQDGSPFTQIGTPQNLPAYSDRDVQHGRQYRYAIAAQDLKGNLSEKSAPVDLRF